MRTTKLPLTTAKTTPVTRIAAITNQTKIAKNAFIRRAL